MQQDIKTGQAVFLTTHPEYRGNVSGLRKDEFRVTWHKSYVDVPPVKGETMDRNNNRRMRFWYQKGVTTIGFGVPS